MILLIDNYDSFVFNLARYFRRMGLKTEVVRNTHIDPAGVRSLEPQLIVLSPGPCTPDEAGCCLDVVAQLHGEFPMLGVCLGHQAIAQALGGSIGRARTPMHGRASVVYHDGRSEFDGLPPQFSAARYHSLVVERTRLPECVEISAWADDGTIMGIRHRHLPVVGWQFHPESVLTDAGFALLHSLMRCWGLKPVGRCPTINEELVAEADRPRPKPATPIPF